MKTVGVCVCVCACVACDPSEVTSQPLQNTQHNVYHSAVAKVKVLNDRYRMS